MLGRGSVVDQILSLYLKSRQSSIEDYLVSMKDNNERVNLYGFVTMGEGADEW